MKKMDESAIAQSVGRVIAKKRTNLGLTQEEVAEQLDIGYEAVSRIERGIVMPTISRLMELAEIFECGIEELLRQTSHRANDQAAYIAGLLTKLSDADRKLVIDVVEKLSARLQKKAR